MENLLGLLRVRVKRGINLAVRDVRSSDPYVVVKMAKQVPIPLILLLFLLFPIFFIELLVEFFVCYCGFNV